MLCECLHKPTLLMHHSWSMTSLPPEQRSFSPGALGCFEAETATEHGCFVNGLTRGRDVQEAYKEQQDQYRLCQSSVLAKTVYSHPPEGWNASGTRELLQSAMDFKVEKEVHMSTNICTHAHIHSFGSGNKDPAFKSKSC